MQTKTSKVASYIYIICTFFQFYIFKGHNQIIIDDKILVRYCITGEILLTYWERMKLLDRLLLQLGK